MRRIALLLVGLLMATSASADTSQNPYTDLLDIENRNLSRMSGGQLDALLRPNLPKPKPNFWQKASKRNKLSYSRDWIDSQPAATGSEQWRCLTEALYFEARGESVKGQFAVAEVIMNRVDSPNFPATLCSVIHQGTGRKYQCQFTYTCDGHKEVISEQDAFERAGKVARLMLDGAPRQLTEGATFYHTDAVEPRWARKFNRTATIGVHHFYKPQYKVSEN